MRQVRPKEYDREYYEKYCTGLEKWVRTKGVKMDGRLEVAFDLAGIKKGMVVVDFGCGRGELVFKSAQRGAKAYGFDYSEEAIKIANSLGGQQKGVFFVKPKGRKIPLADNSVEIVFFIDVIEHLYPEEAETVLGEFKRILKKEGKIILHTAPNKDFYNTGYVWYSRFAARLVNFLFWKKLFKETLPTKKDPRDSLEKKLHVNECTKREIEEFLFKTGFGRVCVWYDSNFRKIRMRDKLRYLLVQPDIGFLKRWFAFDIWAIAQVG